MTTARERYDEVVYLTRPYSDTNPDRLCTIAQLAGLSPPSVATARVLEIGCGTGGNLFPFAGAYPDAQVVGFDISPVQIEVGEAWRSSMGLHNLELRTLDILEASRASLGTFDYVIAHGVYSWVPEPVRERLLTLIQEVLTPDGVGFVSWNALPGWHPRGGVRQVMQFGARAAEEPMRQVSAGMEMLKLSANLAPAGSAWRAVLERESGMLGGLPDSYLFHDFLADVNRSLLLDTFSNELGEAGLAYLGEASWPEWFDYRFTPRAQAGLEQLGGDYVRQQQVRDLIRNRGFHEALVVHAHQKPNRRFEPSRLQDLHVAALLYPVGDVDLREGVDAPFKTILGDEFATDFPLLKAVLMELAEHSPATIPVSELVSRAHAMLGTSAERVAEGADADAHRLLGNLLEGASHGLVDLRSSPVVCTPTPSPRPVAFVPARVLAAQGNPFLPNVRHESVEPAPLDREILQLLDGTRGVAPVVRALVEAAERGELYLTDADDVPITDLAAARAPLARHVESRLLDYARLGLLVG